MNEGIVAEALQAHWSAQDEAVHSVSFSAPALRRQARRRTATTRALVAACLALAAGTAVTLSLPRRGADQAPAEGPSARLVTADGWTLTLSEGPTDPRLPGFSDVTTTICVLGHGSDRGCTGSFAKGPGAVMGVGQGTGLLTGFVRATAARIGVSVDQGPTRPAALAASDDGRLTMFALPWSTLGVAETAFGTHRVTVHAFDAVGREVARFGVTGAAELAAAHPGRREEALVPAPDRWVEAWRTTDGSACVTGPSGALASRLPQWCGWLRPGTTVLGWTYGEGAWGLLLHVPAGTSAVRVGGHAAEVRGTWASVPVREELPAEATVVLTDGKGRQVTAGTVAALRVAGEWAGSAFVEIPAP